jgi:preprotein translocase subunit SecE
VVTPTRRELVTYTGVVLGFVVVMMAIVYVLDLGLSALVVFLFGGAS